MKFLPILLTVLLVAVSSAEEPEVKTSFGVVVGNQLSGGVKEFVGIPYAQPPKGALRFQPPVYWNTTYKDGEISARKFGATCLSNSQKSGSEDCLFLNIWVPGHDTKFNNASRPVLVFIHGGSFVTGSGSGFNGTVLASNTGAVVVTINYRLGSLGFLLVTKGNGNFGLKDQRVALQWVNNEISNFGGQKDKILLFGESAGAISVLLHLFTPQSFGLYHSVVSESGLVEATNESVALNMTHNYVKCAECNGHADVVACLQQKSLVVLSEAENCASREGDPFTGPSFSPVVDGVEFAYDPKLMLQNGHFNTNAHVIAGSNNNEGTLFIYGDHVFNMSVTEYKQYIVSVLAKSTGNETVPNQTLASILSLYPPDPVDNREQAAALIGDATFICGTRHFSRLFSTYGGTVYQYHFNQRLKSDQTPKSWGVYHGSELPFVFQYDTNGGTKTFTPQERHLSSNMQSTWLEMVVAGNPGTLQNVPVWPKYSNNSDVSLILQLNITTEEGRRRKYCDFWDSLGL